MSIRLPQPGCGCVQPPPAITSKVMGLIVPWNFFREMITYEYGPEYGWTPTQPTIGSWATTKYLRSDWYSTGTIDGITYNYHQIVQYDRRTGATTTTTEGEDITPFLGDFQGSIGGPTEANATWANGSARYVLSEPVSYDEQALYGMNFLQAKMAEATNGFCNPFRITDDATGNRYWFAYFGQTVPDRASFVMWHPHAASGGWQYHSYLSGMAAELISAQAHPFNAINGGIGAWDATVADVIAGAGRRAMRYDPAEAEADPNWILNAVSCVWVPTGGVFSTITKERYYEFNRGTGNFDTLTCLTHAIPGPQSILFTPQGPGVSLYGTGGCP